MNSVDFTALHEVADSLMTDASDEELHSTEQEQLRTERLSYHQGPTSIEKLTGGNMKLTDMQLDGKSRSREHAENQATGCERSSQQPDQQESSKSWFSNLLPGSKSSSVPLKEAERALGDCNEARLAGLEKENEELREQVKNYVDTAKVQQESFDLAYKAVVSERDEQLAKQAQEYGDAINALQQAADSQIQGAQDSMRDLSQEVEKSRREYEQQIEDHERTISRMQAARLKTVDATQWAPMENSDVEHRLKSILSRVRQWATEYAMLSIEDTLEPKNFTAVAQQLVKRGLVIAPDRLRDMLKRNKAMQKAEKAFAMLLTAAVSCDLLREVIGDPFFAFVGGNDEKTLLNYRVGKSADRLVDSIKTSDVAGGEALRCQILRLLDPVTSDGVGIMNAKVTAKSSRAAAADHLASASIKAFSGGIDMSKTGDAHAALAALMVEAADLSWELWTRKWRIEVLDWAACMGKADKRTMFNHKSNSLEAHPLHNRDLEDDPEALDGREVVLLCSPLVIRRGDADGQDYDKHKVLRKGVVWVG